jgi:hypothetical protein
LLAADAVEQRLDLRVVGVVAADGDASAAAGGQLLGGVVDRSRASQGRRLTADTATADVDGRSLLAECERDALAAAAARAGTSTTFPFNLTSVIANAWLSQVAYA